MEQERFGWSPALFIIGATLMGAGACKAATEEPNSLTTVMPENPIDSDQDGFSDETENLLGTDPHTANTITYEQPEGVFSPTENRTSPKYPELDLLTAFKLQSMNPELYEGLDRSEFYDEHFSSGYEIIQEGNYMTNCFADVLGIDRGWIHDKIFRQALADPDSGLYEEGTALIPTETEYSELFYSSLELDPFYTVELMLSEAQDGDILVFRGVEGIDWDSDDEIDGFQFGSFPHAAEIDVDPEDGTISFINKIGELDYVRSYDIHELANLFDAPIVSLYRHKDE
ncbi:hypothetical protein GF362_04240 [Candidatus Dojkabacteria bacterium]|nr:hypothetical protein [Candidatus Dojkabacteria bacterium]